MVVIMGVLILPMCARLAAGQDDDPCGSGAVATFNELRLKHGAVPLVEDASLSKAALKLAESALPDETNAIYPPCRKNVNPGETPGSIVWNCNSASNNKCGAFQANNDECTVAVDQWTTYKWDFSETPLEDNKQHLEFGQIVWSKATKVGCASAKTIRASCVYFVCLFDAPLELTDEALKQHVKPKGGKPDSDQYEWCSVLASGDAKKLCSEAPVQCNGGPLAKCCPTSCSASSN